MASATFAERIALDLAILVANSSMIDFSRQRDATATENTARTDRVSQLAAAKVESRLGSAGSYDDTDATIGNQIWLDFGTRIALLRYSQVYSLTLTDFGVGYIGSVHDELEEFRETLVQEAIKLTVGKVDNTALNKRRPNSTWGSTADPVSPPEV